MPFARARSKYLALLAVVVAACAVAGSLWALGGLLTSLLVGRMQSATATGPAASVATAPLPTRMPTSSADVLADEIYRGAALRGRLITLWPEPQADGTELHILIALPQASLADAQWNAFQVQRAVWTGQEFHIPADWQVHIVEYIHADSQTSLGTPIAAANLSAAHASGFPWAQLTPQQAWDRYDGTLYNPDGL